MEFIARQQGCIKSRDQIKTFLINGKKIDIIFVQIAYISFQFAKTWKRDGNVIFFFMEETLSIFVSENDAVAIRCDWFLFIVISMRCDILNLKKSSFW